MTEELKCPNCGTEFNWNDYFLEGEDFDVDSFHSSYMAYCSNCAKRFRFVERYKFIGYDSIELVGGD